MYLIYHTVQKPNTRNGPVDTTLCFKISLNLIIKVFFYVPIILELVFRVPGGLRWYFMCLEIPLDCFHSRKLCNGSPQTSRQTLYGVIQVK